MVRTALAPRKGRSLNRQPKPQARLVPMLSVLAIAYLVAVLPVVPWLGLTPDAGYLMLLAWRLQRADAWPAWWAAPMGLFNDLVTGNPLGMSVMLWSFTMLALDLLDRRTMWRGYWLEWLLAMLFIALSETIQWAAAAAAGAGRPLASLASPWVVGTAAFPLAAYLAGRIDRWRLGR